MLADGFYEWQKTGGSKRPMRIVLRTGEPFAFAGLWSVWRGPDGNRVPSCAIITTSANDLLRPVHDRMPVILPREMEDFWLDESVDDPDALRSVLNPYPDDGLETYEVSSLVNSSANDGPEVMARKEGAPGILKALLLTALLALLVLVACSDPATTAVVAPLATSQPETMRPTGNEPSPTSTAYQAQEQTKVATPLPTGIPTTEPEPTPTPMAASRPTTAACARQTRQPGRSSHPTS